MIHSPTLAAISLQPNGGGVAVVARLLWDVFAREWGAEARLLTLIDGTDAQPSFAEKSRYALRLAGLNAFSDTDSIMFSHLGLAKPLVGVPRRYRKRYSIFLHGIEAWNPLPASQLRLLAGAERRLANSVHTATRVMHCHPEIGPVDACPLALPLDDQRVAVDSGFDADFPRLGPHAVLTVGRMSISERYKGHDELIDAWPDILGAIADAQLVIAGGGDDLPRLRDKAARSSAARSIVFTGFVSRTTLDALYDRAALFALPSRGEGFGLVYLEAMARERACVGSIHDAAGDVIVHGETGRLVDQDERGQLAETIVSLLQDESSRTRMGLAGHQRFHEHFTSDAFAERFLALVNGGQSSLAPRAATSARAAAVR